VHRRRRLVRPLAVLAAVAAAGALLVGCSGNDGEPSREVLGPPERCTQTECPELSVPGVKRVGDSGVTPENRADAVPLYLSAVLDDLDMIWGDWFAELNIEEASTGRLLIKPGTSFTSECKLDGEQLSIPSDFPNAFYCSLDEQSDGQGTTRTGSVVLPVDTFAEIWEGKLMGQRSFMLGDFTAATIVAHEYGHHVMYRLAEAYDLSVEDFPGGANNAELLADCFAGNWAATVAARNDLSLKEVAQTALLMVQIADPAADMGHGTVTERVGAMTRGFTGGSFRDRSETGLPGVCLNKYWPEVLGTE